MPVSCPAPAYSSTQNPSLEKAVADILIPMATQKRDFGIEFAICAYSSSPTEERMYVLRDPLEVNSFLAGGNYDKLEFRIKEDIDEGKNKVLVVIKRRRTGNYERAFVMIDPQETDGLVIKMQKWDKIVIEEVMDNIFAGRYKKFKSQTI